ncbi:flagellin [Exiguobacterium sp. s146]|uniref:flagellin N-terminal helical domain-containing protein n=1 Tax=Exiguobacterium sp. s146 TaxID=2751223 RepID=UPI0020368204|nr:flagellin [Exiguobacterium sp. s146]
MIIKNNSNANQALRQSQINTGQAGKAMQKLSSGLRINQAADDAAGLAISEKMRAQIRGLDQAAQNAVDGISLIQTGEGGLNESHSILQRMRELAVQSANDTNNLADRGAIQKEFNEMTTELNRIGNQTSFNTKTVLNGLNGKGGEALVTHSIPGTPGAIRGIYTVGINTTSLNINDTIQVDGHTFLKSSNDPLLSGEFNDLSTLVTAIRAVPDLNTRYTVQVIGTPTPNGLRFEHKTGEESWSQPNIGTTKSPDPYISSPINTVRPGRGGSQPIPGEFEVYEQDIMPLKPGETIKVEWIGKSPFNNREIELTFIPDAPIQSGGNVRSLAELMSEVSGAASPHMTHNSSSNPIKFEETYTYEGTYHQLKLTRGGKEITLQIGANSGQSMQLDLNDMRAARIGLTSTVKGEEGFTSERVVKNREGNRDAEYALDITTQSGASQAISKIDQATQLVSSERSKMGSWQNRLDHVVANVSISAENLQAAESRIRDVDMAKEMMAFTKSNILGQASQAMIAQANKQPEAILQLLR